MHKAFTEKAIAQSIYRQNQQRNFVEDLVKRIGYPHWDKAMIASKKGINNNARPGEDGDSSSLVYIPFSKPDSITTAAVLAVGLNYMPTDTLYHMIYPNQYKQYNFDTANTNGWNARTVFHLFTEFDYRVFGQKIIKVTDGRILGGEFEDTVTLYRQVQQDGRSNTVMITVCTTYGPFWYARTANHKTNDYGGDYNTICDNFWVQDPNDPGPLEVPGSGGSSGSGITQAGHWDTIPPCPEQGGRIYGTNSQPLECSFIGWQYIWVPDSASYFADYDNWGYKHFETWDVTPEDWQKIISWRTDNIDTTGLDSCIRKVLEKMLNSNTAIGRLLCKMERSVFESNTIEKFKVTYRVRNMGGDTLGYTRPGIMGVDLIWRDTIDIDQGVADSATEIGVATIISHETVHAYLKYLINRYYWTMNPASMGELGSIHYLESILIQ